eukprot:9631399-Prorocentrum_lima.AAC.1
MDAGVVQRLLASVPHAIDFLTLPRRSGRRREIRIRQQQAVAQGHSIQDVVHTVMTLWRRHEQGRLARALPGFQREVLYRRETRDD